MPFTSASTLLPGFGSVTPPGIATDAEWTTEPLPEPAITVALTVKVALAPAGRSTVRLMLPLPEADWQEPPPVAAQVQVTAVSWAGKVSVTVAPATALGPA